MQTTAFQKRSNAARNNSLANTANNAASHQYVLHLWALDEDFDRTMWVNSKKTTNQTERGSRVLTSAWLIAVHVPLFPQANFLLRAREHVLFSFNAFHWFGSTNEKCTWCHFDLCYEVTKLWGSWIFERVANFDPLPLSSSTKILSLATIFKMKRTTCKKLCMVWASNPGRRGLHRAAGYNACRIVRFGNRPDFFRLARALRARVSRFALLPVICFLPVLPATG